MQSESIETSNSLSKRSYKSISKRVIKIQTVNSVDYFLNPQIRQLVADVKNFNSLLTAYIRSKHLLPKPFKPQIQPLPSIKKPSLQQYSFKKTSINSFLESNEMSPICEMYTPYENIPEFHLNKRSANKSNAVFDIPFIDYANQDTSDNEDIYYLNSIQAMRKQERQIEQERQKQNREGENVLRTIQTRLVQYVNAIYRVSNNMYLWRINTESLFRPSKTYSIYDKAIKDSFCHLSDCLGRELISTAFNLSIKSLKRWIDKGTKRKPGGGRHTLDSEMEDAVYKWYKEQIDQGTYPSVKMIKKKAKTLCRHSNFLASKGWFGKFKVKYKLKELEEEKEHIKNKAKALLSN